MSEIMEQAAPAPRLAALPTGTVTFLFTDIEGSTSRWEQFPVAMRAALGTHDTIVRTAIAAAGGAIIQTGGDSFVAAFPTAAGALEAALPAQRGLAAAPWPDPVGPIRVRMALHTGPAEVRADGYHAEYTLNRTARLLAAGYGGQVLLSDMTRELLREHLPAQVTVRDLGSVRLKDLLSPLHVYQLVAPDLPAEFPPLKTLDALTPAPAPTSTHGPAPATAPPAAEESNPYKGLRAFQEADAADFFGRAVLTERLVARLAEAVPLARFLVVVGPSGSGKSSVVRAGLVPALHAGALPGSAAWPVLHVIPGAHPLEELEAALLSIAVNPPERLVHQLSEDERGLIRAVKRVLPRDESSELVLVIDQFEEIFTLVATEPERVQFLASLCAAAADPRSRVRIIATLRADFYDRPLLYPDPGELVRQRTEVVLPLTAAELYQAITAPARRVGVGCEPELVTAIIGEVGEQPGTLPLLQYALTELFEQRVDRTLTLAAYRETGGVLGALARRAEETYAGLASAEQALARQIFLRLVTLGEGVEDTRRRVHLAELESLTPDAGPRVDDQPAEPVIQNSKLKTQNSLEAVLETFGRYRLLTFDRDPGAGGATVEVAHEALLRTWPRLREWLDASRADLRVQRQLLGAAGEWAAAGQDPSFLATGARLAQFGGLASAGDVALTSEERAYLAASVAEQERVAGAERARQVRELALARQAAEAAQQAAAAATRAATAQRSAASRLRGLVAGLAVFLLLAAGLAAYAFSQQAEAQAQGQRAQANAATAVANGAEANAQRATAVARQTETDAQRQLAQANAATAVANGADAVAQRQLAQTNYTRAEAQRLAAEANTLLAQGSSNSAETIALLALRSIKTQYSPQGDIALQGATNLIYPRLVITDTANVNAVAFSPDGKYLLTGDWDNVARLLDAQTGKEVRRFIGHTGYVFWVTFSPDGRNVLTSSLDKTARLWDAQTGQELRRFTHPDLVEGAAFSPDGKYMATGCSDNIMRLWDVQTGAEVRRFSPIHFAIPGGAPVFSPDGKYLLTNSLDGIPRLWDVQSGKQVRQYPGHTTGTGVEAVAFSPDGRLIAAGGDDGKVLVWDVNSASALHSFPGYPGAAKGLAFSPDGHILLIGGGSDTAVRLWDAASGAELKRFTGFTGNVQDVAFSPDGKRIVAGSWDKTVRIWDTEAQAEFPSYPNGGSLTPDGKYVLAGNPNNTVYILDAGTGREVRHFGDGTDCNGFNWSMDGKYLITSNCDFSAEMWEIETGKSVRRFVGHTDQVQALVLSADDKYLLTGSNDFTARLWDAQTGVELHRFTGHTVPVEAVDFSRDDKYALTGSADKTAKLWDLQSGKELRTFSGHASLVYGVAFSPDGKYVLTASDDKTARLWDVQTGAAVLTYTGHTGSVGTALFSPDGKYVLTSAADGTARLWDTKSGLELRRFAGHGAGYSSAYFWQGSKYVQTYGADNLLRLAYADYHASVSYLCGTLPRDFTDEERAEFGITDHVPTCPAK